MSEANDISEIRRALPGAKPLNLNQEFTRKRQDEEIARLAQERELQLKYGRWFLIIVAIQLCVMNIIVILIGLKVLSIDNATVRVFVSGTLLQIFGVVYIISKHLFPRKSTT
jgi:amino acid permease